MNLAIIGSKGAGKGTQIRALIDNFHLVYFSPSEMFRQAAREKTPLGKAASEFLGRGKLVPDDIVNGMVEAWLWKTSPTQNLVFDGFPRTVPQAQFLDQSFEDLKRKLDCVLYLDVSSEVVARRLAGRRRCRFCRDEFHSDSAPFQNCPYAKCAGEHLHPLAEDKPEIVFAMVNRYGKSIEPVLDLYRKDGRLRTVSADADIPIVHEELVRTILPYR